MDPVALALIGIGLMFLLIILQVPVGISMALAGVVGFGVLTSFAPALSLLGTEASSAISNPDLAVIPLFLLMGNFATAAGISEDEKVPLAEARRSQSWEFYSKGLQGQQGQQGPFSNNKIVFLPANKANSLSSSRP